MKKTRTQHQMHTKALQKYKLKRLQAYTSLTSIRLRQDTPAMGHLHEAADKHPDNLE